MKVIVDVLVNNESLTIMELKCTRKVVFFRFGSLKIEEDKTGVDDDWMVSFIFTVS